MPTLTRKPPIGYFQGVESPVLPVCPSLPIGIVVKLKHWLRFPIDLHRAQQLLARESGAPVASLDQRSIVLDLKTDDFAFDGGRHLAALAQQSLAIGSPFFLRCSSAVLAVIARKVHGREMLAIDGVQHLASSSSLPEGVLHLTDHESSCPSAIWLRVGCDAEVDLPVMPYPMHPATLNHFQAANLSSLRKTERIHRVFFAGNQKAKYGQGKIRRQFGLCDRIEVLQCVRNHFPFADESFICLRESRTSPIVAPDWLPTLARADFFLCAPGSSQPTCHHLVESMSVGTIPILEYGDRVTPPLIDAEHAILFRGTDGLAQAIDRVLQMPKEEIESMRSRVSRFFDDHLCQAKFLKRLRDPLPHEDVRRVSLPFHNENFYQADSLPGSTPKAA